ncbi:MAG: polysaccharide deacetylase family protein [Acetobacterales bacterium]
MKLKSHGRYDFSPITERPVYDWPNGTRLAIHFSLNVECFSFGEGVGNDLAGPAPQPNIRSFAWRDWGNRVGVWRMLDALEDFELPCALLLNTETYQHAPQIPAAFRARGDEVVAHGRTNAERQDAMSYDEEKACIAGATAAIAEHEGAPPKGWLAPYICQTYDTPDLLKEAGYKYCMDWPVDDQPVWFRTKHGPLLSVPYAHELNDSLTMVNRRDAARDWADAVIDHIDEMIELSDRYPLVFGMALHTHVLGQPYRMRQFRRVLEHIDRFRDRLWLTHPGAIAEHCAALPAGTVPGS